MPAIALRDLPSEVDIGIAGSGFFARYGDLASGLWVSFLEPVV
jgi:hypothetical protein